jgi:adenosylcobinamide-phosphate synthase
MTTTNLLVACILDSILGDPRWLPHPVRGLGWIIGLTDRYARQCFVSPGWQVGVGIVIAIGLPTLAFCICWWILQVGYEVHSLLGNFLWVVMGYTTLAARDLAVHALAVEHAIIHDSIHVARSAVSRIVGRDTDYLSESEIVRASVETVAESTCDGVISPLFYLAIGGPPLAMAYKAINTLDSMIGHRTTKHEHIGWASARLDDLVNWIPSRLSGLLIVAGSALRLRSGMRAWNVLWRDGAKHASPNSGWPEAAMAGGLHIQLGGVNYYQGKPHEGPKLGDPGTALAARHVKLAVELMWMAFGVAVVISGLLLSL